MPRLKAPDNAWLSAEVPADLAEAFRARAVAADRSVTGHLRHVIKSEVSEAPATTPRLREDEAGQGLYEQD